MKALYRFLFCAVIASSALTAQVSIVSTFPASNAVNVPLTTTLSMTFNTELDTTAFKSNNNIFTNIQSAGEPYFSPDGKTFSAVIQLQTNTAYFITFFAARGKDGSALSAPFILYFTTGSAFPSLTVSGTVSSGTTGVSPQNSVVGLSNTNLQNQNDNGPEMAMLAIVNNDGSFVIPYVSDGKYFPFAVKDVNEDGNIDPEDGTDVVALGDSIVVNGSSVTGVTLSFIRFSPMLLSEAVPIADSLSLNLPPGSILKRVVSYNLDTLGYGRNWEFQYFTPSISGIGNYYGIKVSPNGSETTILDQNQNFGLNMVNMLSGVSLAASSAAVLANVEAAGGKDFRLQPGMEAYEFEEQATLGDLNFTQYNNMPHDQNTLYWAVSYGFGESIGDTNWISVKQMYFLCDFTTGAVITTVTGVSNHPSDVPSSFALYQNYPNPFNPSTMINYQLAMNGYVTLKVYDAIGKEIATLVNGIQEAGEHSTSFNASHLPSGLYFYSLQTKNFSATKKMILVK